MKKLLFAIAVMATLASCTANERARKYGGEETVEIPPGERFINITWKNDNMWIIVQDTASGVYYAREKSSYGILEGQITIKPAFR